MAYLARLVLLLAVFGVASFRTFRLRTQSRQGKTQDSPPKSTVVILGNVDTGKSTLCQWLLARTDICTVHPGVSEHTQDLELATGYWFNDPALGELEVIDTPGFTLSPADESKWVNFTEYIQKSLPKIDALIFTSNPNSETGELRHAVVQMLRQSFGTDIWDRVVKFVPIRHKFQRLDLEPPEWDGYTLEQWAELNTYWTDTFKDVEFNMSLTNWWAPHLADSRAQMEASINDVSVYGAYLKVNAGWPMVQAHAIDFNQPGFPVYSPADVAVRLAVTKIPDLEQLRLQIVQTRSQHGQWDLDHLVPRWAPSQVDGNKAFECNWPHQCTLEITGAYLSDADVLRIFPADHTCGDDFAGFLGEIQQPVENPEARPKLMQNEVNHTKVFHLGSTMQINGKDRTDFKICYCEYGFCDSPARFFQEVGTLSVQAIQCPVMCPGSGVNAMLKGGQQCGLGETILAMDSLEYECNFGYAMNGQVDSKTFTRECNKGGDLEAIQHCSRVKCTSAPTVPTNSVRITADVGQQYTWGDPVHFLCDSGFTLDGNNDGAMRVNSQCGPTGTWAFLTGEESRETWDEFLVNGGCRQWTVGEWSACDAECGSGKHNREVTCAPIDGHCNDNVKPATEQDCSGFGACPDCGEAPDLTSVYAAVAYQGVGDPLPRVVTGGAPVYYDCDHHNGYTLTGEPGRAYDITSFTVECKKDQADPLPHLEWTFPTAPFTRTTEEVQAKACRRWETTDWADCSVSCGTGYQFREVQCSTGDEGDCVAEHKPTGVITSKSCFRYVECEDRLPNDGAVKLGGGVALALLVVVCSIVLSVP